MVTTEGLTINQWSSDSSQNSVGKFCESLDESAFEWLCLSSPEYTVHFSSINKYDNELM